MVHAIEKYRKDEQRLKEQEKSIQRKIAQLQLSDLQNKKKTKTQAPVMNGATNYALPVPAEQLPTAQLSAPPTQPPLVANVYYIP